MSEYKTLFEKLAKDRNISVEEMRSMLFSKNKSLTTTQKSSRKKYRIEETLTSSEPKGRELTGATR